MGDGVLIPLVSSLAGTVVGAGVSIWSTRRAGRQQVSLVREQLATQARLAHRSDVVECLRRLAGIADQIARLVELEDRDALIATFAAWRQAQTEALVFAPSEVVDAAREFEDALLAVDGALVALRKYQALYGQAAADPQGAAHGVLSDRAQRVDEVSDRYAQRGDDFRTAMDRLIGAVRSAIEGLSVYPAEQDARLRADQSG